MPNMPGVYVEEQHPFPSITQVNTSIPIFVGYTENSTYLKKSFIRQPIKISSFLEFQKIFGGEFNHQFQCISLPEIKVEPIFPRFYLLQSVFSFFANGGKTCFILSLNKFQKVTEIIESDYMNQKLWLTLENCNEADLIVMPDLANVTFAYSIYNKLIVHCSTTKFKFALLDINPLKQKTMEESIQFFRDSIQLEGVSFSAAYYPWLNTGFHNINDFNPTLISNFETTYMNFLPEEGLAKLISKGFKHKGLTKAGIKLKLQVLHQSLLSLSPTYKIIMENILFELNKIPPSGSIAGIYAQINNQRGIWKAPANISLSMVTTLTEKIDDIKQQDLTISITGKSINVIREFTGNGFVVWGARTLDGNNQEWRYINVRRTSMMIEHSIQNFLSGFTFEPNNAVTWARIKQAIDNFLFNLWKQGALVGNKPELAYQVKIGLGLTMTSQDITDGNIVLEILLSLLRPAEFIVVQIKQKIQSV